MRWRSVLSFVGRTFITTGLLILLFVAYQLWGTGIYEHRQQRSLKTQFQRAQAAHASTTTTSGPGPTSTVTATTQPPVETPTGDAVAIIQIPRIGVDRAVVEGVGLADLRKGPGHYPRTVMPGEVGNAAIAGHRTTYGAPFNRLDELQAGDPILVTTLRGTFRYRVVSETVVDPSDVRVLQPTPEPRLTLTTCDPKYSAAHRRVVVASLDTSKSPEPTPPPPEPVTPPATGKPAPKPTSLAKAEAGLSGVRANRRQAVEWGALAALVGLVWWFAFHRRRRVWVWFAGAIPFLTVLFFFFGNLERVLPGNF